MRDVVKLYWELRGLAEKYSKELAHSFSVERHEDPAAFFNMAFNSITMTIELLDYYRGIWRKPKPADFPNVDETEQKNAERIMLLQKMCFIDIMSSFEFSAKKIVLSNTELFGDSKGRIYLPGIMARSLEKCLIDERQLNLWKGVSYLRNALIHNNGIAEEDNSYDFPEVTVIFKKDIIIQGDLKQFGLITKWLLGESKTWTENANL